MTYYPGGKVINEELYSRVMRNPCGENPTLE
jgi:hypothetical protein